MLGRMIGGGGYQSARDGLFGEDPLANSLGGAINRPQEMMAAQPEQKQGGGDLLSMISPLGSILAKSGIGMDGATAGIAGGLIPGLLAGLGNKKGANGSIAGLLGLVGNQAANGQGAQGQGATWLNELFTGGQGANNAGFRQTPDGMPMGYYVRR